MAVRRSGTGSAGGVGHGDAGSGTGGAGATAGTAGLTAPQMTQWVNWYVGALADTARWQANAVRNFGFTGYIQVVPPGIGVLNNKIPSLVATNLPNGTLGVGAAWGRSGEHGGGVTCAPQRAGHDAIRRRKRSGQCTRLTMP